MKQSSNVTSSRRKCRKAHFTAPAHVRRIKMSSALSNDLRAVHGIRSLPIKKDDEVYIHSGFYKGRDGKVIGVKRSKYVIYIDKVTREKVNGNSLYVDFVGTTVNTGVHPSNVTITRLNMDKYRTDLLKRKEENKEKVGNKSKA